MRVRLHVTSHSNFQLRVCFGAFVSMRLRELVMFVRGAAAWSEMSGFWTGKYIAIVFHVHGLGFTSLCVLLSSFCVFSRTSRLEMKGF